MANKSIIAVVLLLCVADIFEVQAYKKLIGSDSISSKKGQIRIQDFYYHVPSGAVSVTYTERKPFIPILYSLSSQDTFGYARAILIWSRGQRTARIHARVKGNNRISWWVYAHFDD